MRLVKAAWLIWIAGVLAMMPGGVNAQQGSGFSDLPSACGTAKITIAQMPWPSAVILAHVHARILEARFGCDVQVVAGGLTATGSSMATTGQPSVAPELWITRIAEIWNPAIENQNVRQAGLSFAGTALEGWFIPDFVAENHPELSTVEDLRDYWQVFQSGKTGKAQLISCPSDWACSIINRNMLRALELDGLFEVVEPANRFELDTLIGEAMSKHTPILFYYWQPNAVLAQFSFRQLGMGNYDRDAFSCLAKRTCNAPKPSSFAPEPVVIALADRVFEEAPQIAGYFQRAHMPIAEMNMLLAWQSEQGKTGEEAAERFVETREEIWRTWLGIF